MFTSSRIILSTKKIGTNHYDNDEIADDMLFNIKHSEYKTSLQEGIQIIEQKMSDWKNSEGKDFPSELTIDNFATTLMLCYIEKNIDPLRDAHRGNQRVAARAAYYNNNNTNNRGRSRSNNSYQRNNYRQRSNRYNNRSNTPSRRPSGGGGNMRDCPICHGQHMSTTIGCPHLLRQHHANEYINSRNHDDIQQEVADMERKRSRSRSNSRQSRPSSRN